MLLFAPLQGFTTASYRRAHHEVVGGIDEYYAPFVRLEHGELRRKDLRDCAPDANVGVPTAPQVIARDADEFAQLCDALAEFGWNRIDLNMGCPFPMQVHAGRGCGLLQHPAQIAAIADEMSRRPDIAFSVKMRLGQDNPDQCLTALDILSDLPLRHIVLHPRLGIQQYKGSVDLNAFDRFYSRCQLPLVFNGDLTTTDQIQRLLLRYPHLSGIMLGRGLLAQPWLFSDKEPAAVVQAIHDRIYQHVTTTLQGQSQMLPHLQAFWQYMQPILPHKTYKTIQKSRTLTDYLQAATQAISYLHILSNPT